MPARQYRTTVDARTVQTSLGNNASTDTTLTLNSPAVNTLPTAYPYTLVIDPDTTNEEIVTVTAGASNVLTVVRARDNTTVKAHAVGAAVRHMITARDLQEPQEHMAATGRYLDSIDNSHYEPHGLGSTDGVFVGTTKTQTLTNKTISAGTLSGTTTNSGTITGGTINASSVPASGITGTTLPSAITTATGLAITESQVTNLVSDLAAKAPLASPTFTGTVTIPAGASINAPNLSLNAGGNINLGVSATTSLTAATINISAVEVSRLSGVTSNIQTQIDGKVDTSTLGVWQAWSPSINSAGWVGTWSLAKYVQIGKTVHFRGTFTLSGTPTGATALNVSLPVTASTSAKGVFGNGTGTVSGAGNPVFALDQTSTTAIDVRYLKDFGAAASGVVHAAVTASLPGTWANTNSFTISGTYEAA